MNMKMFCSHSPVDTLPQAAASKGDLTASKRAYVDLVAALQSWSSASQLSFKGLN